MSPELDGGDVVCTGLHNFIADPEETLREIRMTEDMLQGCPVFRWQHRYNKNIDAARRSAGASAKKGDLVLVLDPDSTLSEKSLPRKLIQKRWMRP